MKGIALYLPAKFQTYNLAYTRTQINTHYTHALYAHNTYLSWIYKIDFHNYYDMKQSMKSLHCSNLHLRDKYTALRKNVFSICYYNYIIKEL